MMRLMIARARNALRRRPGRYALYLAGLVLLAWTFGPNLWAHAHRAIVDGYVNDDSRVWITPFLRNYDSTLLQNDALQEYAAACEAPGYRLLYMALAQLAHPQLVSSILPYALYAIFLVAIGIAAAKFARAPGAFAAVALCLSSDVFIERMAGGLPRAFAYPIAACGVAALVHGRLRALSLVTVLGALFYAAAALPLGMTLGVVALLFGRKHRGDLKGAGLPQRLALVAGTALAAGVMLAPTAIAMRPYGGYIRPTEIKNYPEAGPGGRFYGSDHPPFKSFLDELSGEVPRVIRGSGPLVESIQALKGDKARLTQLRLAVMSLALLLVAVLALRRHGAARRVLAYVAVIVVGYHVAAVAAPWLYLPQRYIGFPVPVLTVVLLAAAPMAFLRLSSRRWAGLIGSAGLVLVLALFGTRGSAKAGLNTPTRPMSPVQTYIASLPRDVLIAGWPSSMDSVPLITARRAFLTQENHMPFSKGFAEHMRRRVHALFDAYFAKDDEPLKRLRDQFHVTHLVFDINHLHTPPRYFKPFDRVIVQRTRGLSATNYQLLRLVPQASFRSGSTVVLDLTRL